MGQRSRVQAESAQGDHARSGNALGDLLVFVPVAFGVCSKSDLEKRQLHATLADAAIVF